MKENSFVTNWTEADKTLNALEKKHLLIEGVQDETVQWRLGEHMQHSYFLDTVTNIRSTTRCGIDMLLVVLIVCFLMGGLHALRDKNIIDNYHEPWVSEMFPNFPQ